VRQKPERLGIDETSFQKRHEYVTVVTDPDKSTVLEVIDDRKKEPLEKVLKKLGFLVLSNLKSISMNMHAPFIAAVKSAVPDAGSILAFDKFHVIAHLTKAVNQVRREEHIKMTKNGDEYLKGTRYLWITGEENLSDKQSQLLKSIKRVAKLTPRAWRLKEIARGLWSFTAKHHALKAWKTWCRDAINSNLNPMQKVAKMIHDHLQGIITAVLLKVTNAKSEALNNRIQQIKRRACGFRNRVRFKNAIFFHLAGLKLYPA
jgi:transposase